MGKPEVLFHLARRDGLEIVRNAGHALRYPLHTHESVYTVTLVRRGTVFLVGPRAAARYPAGSVYVVAPHEPHAPTYTDDFSIVSLCVDKEHFRTRTPGALASLCFGYLTMLASGGFLSSEDVRTLLLAVDGIHRLPPPCPSPDPPALHPGPGVSPSSHIRRFRGLTGLTPHQYRAQERIRQAKRLLAGSVPIAEAALMAGFFDQSHCNRWFARSIGITPRQYRNSCFLLDG